MRVGDRDAAAGDLEQRLPLRVQLVGAAPAGGVPDRHALLADGAPSVAHGVEADVGAQRRPVALHELEPQAQGVGDRKRGPHRARDRHALGRADELEPGPPDQLGRRIAEHALERRRGRDAAAVPAEPELGIGGGIGKERQLLR